MCWGCSSLKLSKRDHIHGCQVPEWKIRDKYLLRAKHVTIFDYAPPNLEATLTN